MKNIAIVVPRYDAHLGAGAEGQAAGFADELAQRGWPVEVWTTCALSHYDWTNELPAGEMSVDGILVRRFPITGWDAGRRAELEQRLATTGTLSIADADDYFASGPISQPLFHHVATQAANFDAIVVLPYLMSISYYAAWAALDKVVLWPCLHDESYAYLEPIRLLMESVGGVMFNSPEEGELAIDRLAMRPRRYTTLGEGVTLAEPTAVPPTKGDYLLFLGRLEEGKNLALLYDYMERYVDAGGDLRLMLVGKGPFQPPRHTAFDYRGYLADGDKAATLANAVALCQPSLNESFSLVMMESWLAGRPALVHRDCAVTRGHVQRARAGLFFRTYEEFAASVDWLRAQPDLADRMGRNGRSYVEQNYTWPAVVDRFEQILDRWAEPT